MYRTFGAYSASLFHNAACAGHGIGLSPSSQLSPKVIQTTVQSAATAHRPLLQSISERRICSAARSGSGNTVVACTAQTRKSSDIRSSSKSSSTAGLTSTVAMFSNPSPRIVRLSPGFRQAGCRHRLADCAG